MTDTDRDGTDKSDDSRDDSSAYSPPECCGQTCEWSEFQRFWICRHRDHHRYNDFGEEVDESGQTDLERQITLARRAHVRHEYWTRGPSDGDSDEVAGKLERVQSSVETWRRRFWNQ